MPLKIISAEERMATLREKNTIVIVGPVNVGKTSLIRTVNPAETLMLNIEAGLKAVQDVPFDHVDIDSFTEVVDLACLLGGPLPGRMDNDFFSPRHHKWATENYKLDLKRYKNLFIDSITDLTRLGMEYAKTTPAAISEKTGREDLRGAYGELARKVIDLLKRFQHAPMVNIFFLGILEEYTDEWGKKHWQMQLEGQRVPRELAGIVDNIFTMSYFDYTDAGWVHNPPLGAQRAFCCYGENPWGLPGKNRSNGVLDLIEPADLTHIIGKLNPPLQQAAQ